MKRRDFIKLGSLAAGHEFCNHVQFAFAQTRNSAKPKMRLINTAYIWSSTSLPVALMAGGAAEKIASSPGEARPKTADLHSVFLKTIKLPDRVLHARIHLACFTRYRLYVNGVYVGRGPCRYQNQRPEYDTRDLVPYLKTGVNRIVILVHRDAPTGRIMQHEPGLAALIEWSDARREHFVSTDASWLSAPDRSFQPRPKAWASIEENIDARIMPQWINPDPDVTEWTPSVIVAPAGQTTVWPRDIPLQAEARRKLAAPSPTLPLGLAAGDKATFGVGEIVQGFHILEMDAEAGSLVEVVYKLPQAEIAGQCTYICREGQQVYMGGDTFAFREIDVRIRSGKVTLRRIEITEVRYPFERVGSFECSDPFFNQLWRICARTLEILSEDAYVDCADRERVEWTDCSPPAFDCTRVMMRGPEKDDVSYWGDNRLLRGLLRRISLTQQPDGQMKAHSCSERFDIHAIMEDRTCDWVVLLREYYDSSADAAFIREMWPSLVRLLPWYFERTTERGLVQAREWEVWDNPLRYQVCEGAGLNAMVYRAVSDAAYLAQAVGMNVDHDYLSKKVELLGAAFNKLLWSDSDGAYYGALFGAGSKIQKQNEPAIQGRIKDGRYPPTAQANLFALYAGVVPEDRVFSVRAWILSHVDEVREPMSHYYLFKVLYDMKQPQRDQQALELARRGWANQVESDWGTAWEDLEKGGGSKVHIYGVVPGYFLSANVLGARRVGPISDRNLIIEPRTSSLSFARGVCVTEFGPVQIEWRRTSNGGLRLKCDLPEAVHTELRLYYLNKARLNVNGRDIEPIRKGNFVSTPLRSRRNIVVYEAF